MKCVYSFCWIFCLLIAGLARASEAPPCDAESSKQVAYQTVDSQDVMTVKVSGAPCRDATVIISIKSQQGKLLYLYEADFIDHMPYLIMEPELNFLVDFYINKVLQGAVTRNTSELPEYAGVDEYYEYNNDFILVSQEEYEQLREQQRPIVWHITGESTWTHSIYDAATGNSKLILRGGVFQ